METLSQKEIKVIEQYCGADFGQRCKGVLHRTKEKKVRIVNTGMVSSGKSSLFNALIDSSGEYFPTGAARTTTQADFFEYNDISYIDTPGIDVKNEDDAVAFCTIMEADIVLMAHNIRTGPLNRSEVEWLERIAAGMNSREMCQSRLVFVNTWKDTREKDVDYEDIISDVKDMVFATIGVEIPCFEVSVKKYQSGIKNQKDILVANSGIQELRDFLEKFANEYTKKKEEIDRTERELLFQDIRKQLDFIKAEKEAQVHKIQTRVSGHYKSRRSAWQNVYDYFAAQRSKLTNLQNELEEMYRDVDSLFKGIWQFQKR